MVYQNKYDKTGTCAEDGKRAEKNFERLYQQRFGILPKKASSYDDKEKHIDYYMDLNTSKGFGRFSVDVKSWKKCENGVFVEFVSYGKLGWIYGEADFIGFESPDMKSFKMVKRTALLDYVKEHCVVDFYSGRDIDFWRIHVRLKETEIKDEETNVRIQIGLYDCITKIPRDDLDLLDHWVLAEKEEQ